MRVLVALACVLALASSASAEGAWVMWEKFSANIAGEPTTWRRVEAFAAENECKTATLREARLKVARERRNARAVGLQVEVDAEFELLIFSYECFPDTVDPRGVAGK